MNAIVVSSAHPLVALRERRGTRRTPGRPACATTSRSRGCRASSAATGRGSGVRRARPGRCRRAAPPGCRRRRPGPTPASSSGSVTSKPPTWTCTLNTSTLRQAGRRRTPRRPSSGKNVPQTAASGTRAAKPAAQSLSHVGHPGPVRVGQRGEARDAEGPAAPRRAPRRCRGSAAATAGRSAARPRRTGRAPCAITRGGRKCVWTSTRPGSPGPPSTPGRPRRRPGRPISPGSP